MKIIKKMILIGGAAAVLMGTNFVVSAAYNRDGSLTTVPPENFNTVGANNPHTPLDRLFDGLALGGVLNAERKSALNPSDSFSRAAVALKKANRRANGNTPLDLLFNGTALDGPLTDHITPGSISSGTLPDTDIPTHKNRAAREKTPLDLLFNKMGSHSAGKGVDC